VASRYADTRRCVGVTRTKVDLAGERKPVASVFKHAGNKAFQALDGGI